MIADRKKASAKDKPQYDKMVEDGQRALEQLTQQREAYSNDTSGSLYLQDMGLTLARTAAAPFGYKKTSSTLEANPFALAGYKSSMAFGNAMRLYARKRADKKADEKQAAFDEWQNTPLPTVNTIKIKDASGKDQEIGVVQFDKKGGLSIEQMAETIAGAFTKGEKVFGADIFSQYGMNSATYKGESISEKLKKGEFQGWYSPATKEFVITTPRGISRAPADQHTQRVMEPVYNLFDPTAKKGVRTSDGISLDGFNTYRVYSYKQADDAQPSLFTPQLTKEGVSPSFDISRVDDKDFKNAIGFNVSKTALYEGDYEGVLVAAEYNTSPNMFPGSGNVQGTMKMASIMTPAKFEQMKKDGFITTGSKAQYIYKKGTQVQFVDNVDGGPAGSIISQNQMRYETRPGGGYRNVRAENQYKKAKNTTETLDDDDDNLLEVND
jgi:hypothetical protein